MGIETGRRPVHALLLWAALLAAGAVPAAQLEVMPTGLGSGSITSTTPGIACGADCSETLAAGATIVLTATASAGSTFTGWSGDCSGAAACTVAMTQDRRVRAIFQPSAAIPTTSPPKASPRT